MPSNNPGRGRQHLQGFRTIPRLREPASIPSGPRLYKTPRDKGYVSEFTNPPPGFVNGQTSTTEWYIYLAIWKVFGLPGDARRGPFEGYPGVFGYQVGGSGAGQSKIDFVIYPTRKSRNRRMAFRIQTEYFHNFVDAEKQAYDLLQAWNLSEYNDVVDLYDYEFAEDPTGQAACVQVKRALAGELWQAPGVTGYAMRVRPSRRIG